MLPRMRPILASFLLGSLAAAASAAPPVSYDAMFDPDFSGRAAEHVSWSPDGRKLGYVWDDGQGEALWTLDPVSGKSEAVLRLSGLEKAAGAGGKTELDDYTWSPKGDALLLEADGDLYLYSLAGPLLRRLTQTAAEEKIPTFSPDGLWVAFVRDYDLYTIHLETGREVRFTKDGRENEILNGINDWLYWEEIWDREDAGLWWSPDGKRIAYYRFDEREVPAHPLVDESPKVPQVNWQKYPKPGDPNPKVRVGVLDLATGRTLWMETGGQDQYLARVGWTPDGGAVVIQSLARSQTRLDLLRCGATDGRCSTLASESWPTWVNLGDDLHLLPDGRFLWGSERTGWRRLYLFGADGRLIRPVTPEGWSVTSLDGVAEDGAWVTFTAFRTEGLGPADRHVLRARLDEERWEELTAEPGTHSADPSPRTGAWVHAWSTADAPARTEVRLADGKAIPLPSAPPAGYDPAALPKWELLTLPGPEGSRLPARLLKPAGFDPSRRYPVIVYQYGGPGSQTVTNRWDTRRRDLWHKRMAQLGYAVFTVDNQSSVFFGKQGEDRDYRHMGEVNLAGQLAGVEYLKTLGWVDPARIGLWGWSGGGTNTLLCLLRRPGVWKAGVSGAPVTDWHLYDSAWTERYLDTPQDNEAGYLESSPLTYAGSLKDRLLIVHGLADDNVHPQNTVVMVAKLVDSKMPVEQAFYPGEKHAMGTASMRHFFERMEAFFAAALTP